MARLVDADRSATRQGEVRQQSPSFVLHRLAVEDMRLHPRDKGFDVIAHEVQLVHVVLLRRMDSNLRWRQAEDQPSVSDIDVRQAKHVAQKRAIGLGLVLNITECAPVSIDMVPSSHRLRSMDMRRTCDRYGNRMSPGHPITR